MRIAEWLDYWAKRLSRWSPVEGAGHSQLYQPVKIRSVEDLRHIGEHLTVLGGRVEYIAGGLPRKLEDFPSLPEAQLRSLAIHSYAAAEPTLGPNGVEDRIAGISLNAISGRRRPGGGANVYATVSRTMSQSDYPRWELSVDKLQALVDGATVPIGFWERRKPYVVLDQTTQADLRNRKFERKIRWQSWIGGAFFGALFGILSVAVKGWMGFE